MTYNYWVRTGWAGRESANRTDCKKRCSPWDTLHKDNHWSSCAARNAQVHRAPAFCKWDRHITGYTSIKLGILLLDWPCQLVYTNPHSLPMPKHLKKPDYFWCFPHVWTVAFLHIDQLFLLSSFNCLDILLKRAKRVFITFFFLNVFLFLNILK